MQGRAGKMKIKRIMVPALSLLLFLAIIIGRPGYTPANAITIPDGNSILSVNIVGLKENGDCTIIKYGDIQILIDSAESSSSFSTIRQKMSDAMENDAGKTWDFIIFTHPDQDHIGNATRVFDLFYNESGWKIGTIIDYDFSEVADSFYSTNVAKEYRNRRDSLCEKNGIQYFQASSLDENNLIKSFSLGPECDLIILFNYIDTYKEVTRNKQDQLASSDSNQISVCTLIKYKNQKLLFTGDLEEAGERGLEKYHHDLIKKVTFFKAGHHGSDTSNTKSFIDLIRPVYVSITKMNRTEYPDDSITRFLRYTDYIYPTYVEGYDGYYSLFGDELFQFDGDNVSVRTTDNSDKKTLRDAIIQFGSYSENWFENRLDDSNGKMFDVLSVIAFDEGSASYSNCTLIKYGHYDILVDCGSTNGKSTSFVKMLKEYVVDNVIEYVIVTHYHSANISQLIGTYLNRVPKNDGVFGSFDIGLLIDSKATTLSSLSDDSYYSRYSSMITDSKAISNHTRLSLGQVDTIKISENLSLRIAASKGSTEDEDNCSIATLVNYYDHRLLLVGDLVDYKSLASAMNISNLDFLRASNSAASISCLNKRFDYSNNLKNMNAKCAIVGSALNYRMPNGALFGGEDYQASLINSCGKIYSIGYINTQNEYISDNGTLVFSLNYSAAQTNSEIVSERSGKIPNYLR